MDERDTRAAPAPTNAEIANFTSHDRCWTNLQTSKTKCQINKTRGGARTTDFRRLKADYLVVGAGASGMAFVDEILQGSPDKTVVMVDKRAQAGGHWVDAYNFVSLHMPAGNYGVRSAPLGTSDDELSTKPQIVAYYDQLMKRFIASGRVRFYPMSQYQGSAVVYVFFHIEILHICNI